MARSIPASGINLFQLIYILKREYEEKSGQKALNLSLGNPDGVPPESILTLQAKYAANPAYEYHTYAEDGDRNNFAAGMIESHCGVDVTKYDHLLGLPIAGIKTAGALMPLACGAHLPDKKRRHSFVVASNVPAYDVIGTWTNGYLGAERVEWPLLVADGMRLNIKQLDHSLSKKGLDKVDLVYVIRPGNPAAVGANKAEWTALIDWCVAKGARLVNDGAYAALCEEGKHTSLASVAKDRKDVEWIEMFSVSKSFSDPGARLGALIGSKDFVDDFKLIKGNADSGPVPSVMAAYGEFFDNKELSSKLLTDLKDLYQKRLSYVISKLREAGLEQACETSAGFFTLWKVPKEAFGVTLADDPRCAGKPLHEAFNRLVIDETGIVGVHFQASDEHGERVPLIRYAVCDDVLAPSFQSRFEEGLARMKPVY